MTILYAVLAVSAVVMVSIFARIDNWSRDWTTNFARLENSATDPDLRPLILTETPNEAAQRVEKWLQGKTKWSLQSTVAKETVTQMHLTRTTGLMRFTDDIQLKLVAIDGGTRVEAESQSRVGKGDLGQNPRNLKELVQGLRTDD